MSIDYAKQVLVLDKQCGLGWHAGLTQQLRQDHACHDIRLPSRGGSYGLEKKGMAAEPGKPHTKTSEPSLALSPTSHDHSQKLGISEGLL